METKTAIDELNSRVHEPNRSGTIPLWFDMVVAATLTIARALNGIESAITQFKETYDHWARP